MLKLSQREDRCTRGRGEVSRKEVELVKERRGFIFSEGSSTQARALALIQKSEVEWEAGQ